MARTKKIIEEIPEETEEQTPVFEVEEQAESVRERLQALSLDGQNDFFARIYRVQKPKAGGRSRNVFVGSREDFVDEDYIAENFGGGAFLILYTWKEDGKTQKTTQTMFIDEQLGHEREKTVERAPGGLNGIFENLTAEKITAGVTFFKMLKEILAPPPPQIDLTKLIEVMAANNRPQSISDAVLVKAMDSLQQQKQGASISQQLADLKAIKELANDVNDNGNDNEEGGTMDYLLKAGLQMLPGLLQKQGGDFRATGEAVRENALVNKLICENPDLAQKFFEEAAQKYGVEQAQQLAAGFGYNVTQQEPAPAIPAAEKAV